MALSLLCALLVPVQGQGQGQGQERLRRAERGDGVGHQDNVDQKLRHRQRKKVGVAKGKKLRLARDIDTDTNASSSRSYGASLPAFAFDYSEYLAGAVIERSSLSDNLYLTMFFVGHRSVAHDWPFDSLSTAEEVLYSWGRAARQWNHTSTRTDHRFSAETGESRSGIMCVMQGEGVHKAHSAPAHWVAHSDPMADSTARPMTGTFEVLRCPIRGNNRAIYDTLSRGDDALFVDLVRMRDMRDRGGGHSTGLRGSSGGTRPGSHARRALRADNTDDRISAVQQSQDQAQADRITKQHHVLISFSVPWKARQTGFGVNFHMQPLAGHFDLWQPTVQSLGTAATSASGSASGGGSGSGSGPKRSGVSLCVSGLRPLHPLRAEVGLPMLLEFVEHHVALGVDHIFLGAALDWESPVMRKYLLLLQPYIEAGHVSISSLSLAGFDDAMGFSGMHLNEHYADLFFLNQCLYLNKGIADFVVPLKPSQFLVLPEGAATLADAVASMTAAGASDSVGAGAEPLCSSPVDTYFLPDPAGTFGTWGPADSFFSAEFFAASKAKATGPLREEEMSVGDRLSPHLVSTKHAWLAGGKSAMVCGSGHSYIPSYITSVHGRRHGHKPGSAVADAPKGAIRGSSSAGGLTVYHLVEKAPRHAPAADAAGFLVLVALQQAWDRLKSKTLGSPAEINAYLELKSALVARSAHTPALASSMQKPFWLPATSAHLVEVLAAVLPSPPHQ